jgi:2-methylisocitrate lyase-like PEP mutase family enzyme
MSPRHENPHARGATNRPHSTSATRREFLVRGAAGAIGLSFIADTVFNAALDAQIIRLPPGTPGAAGRSKKLKDLLVRKNKIFAVMGVADGQTAKMMGDAGVEVAFIGTSNVQGRYTNLADRGLTTATESLVVAKYLAEACSFPLILDGDTGHGGPYMVRRLVQECIRIGLAGIRMDDQEIEAKRTTGNEGVLVVSREHAVERYQAAVKARNELDPNFVIMAQCYARKASNGGMDELLARLQLYEKEGGCDWVQFERPQTVDEIKRARAAVKGPLTAMRGDLPKALTFKEHADLGLAGVWSTGWPASEMDSATRAALADYKKRGPVVLET